MDVWSCWCLLAHCWCSKCKKYDVVCIYIYIFGRGSWENDNNKNNTNNTKVEESPSYLSALRLGEEKKPSILSVFFVCLFVFCSSSSSYHDRKAFIPPTMSDKGSGGVPVVGAEVRGGATPPFPFWLGFPLFGIPFFFFFTSSASFSSLFAVPMEWVVVEGVFLPPASVTVRLLLLLPGICVGAVGEA